MPIHDWTRVTAGAWHDFHLAWIAEIRNALNGGILPVDYYAQAEQIAGPFGPDVLALQMPDTPIDGATGLPSDTLGGVAVSVVPPPMRLTAEAEMNDYVLKRRTRIIRHASGDRIVALLEIVSPGNKASRHVHIADYPRPSKHWSISHETTRFSQAIDSRRRSSAGQRCGPGPSRRTRQKRGAKPDHRQR